MSGNIPYWLLTLVLLICTDVLAQEQCSFELKGRVTDEHDGQPLPFATVFIIETQQGGISDSAGYFRIGNICAGTYTIRASYLGAETDVHRVVINANHEMDFHPEIHPEEIGISDVVVEREQKVLVSEMNRMLPKDMLEIRGKSLGEGLKKVPGLSSLSTGSSISKPVIHGLHSNRVLILNNGVRQESQQWGNEHAPEIDPFVSDAITVVKGAGTLRFGSDAIGGIILLEPRALPLDYGVKAELNLVGMNNGRQGQASGMIEGKLLRIKSFSWRLQGSLKRSGNIEAPNYFLKNTGAAERNFSWAAEWLKKRFGVEAFYSQFNAEIGIFSASHIGNLTDLARAFAADEPLEYADFTYEIGRPRQELVHELFKLNGHIHTGTVGEIQWMYARQYNLRQEYDKDLPLDDSLAALNLPALRFELTTHIAEVGWEHYTWKSLKGFIGVAFMNQSNTYEGRYFIPFFEKNNTGIYWTEEWKSSSDRLRIQWGARYDFSQLNVFKWEENVLTKPAYLFQDFALNAGADWKISEFHKIIFNTGKSWRPPHVGELYSEGLHHGAAALEFGDVELDKEKALNTSLTWEYRKKHWGGTIELFHNIYDNFIYLRPQLPAVLTIRGAFPSFRYAQTVARISGTDMRLDVAITDHWQMEVGASVLSAWNKTESDYLVMMPANRLSSEIKYVAFLDQKRVLDLFLNFEHVFEQKRTPENSDYVAPPAAYTLFGMGLNSTFYMNKQQFNVGIEVSNLWNVSYRDYLNRFRYYSDEMGRNITLRINIPLMLHR
jgi:iron complex outermembrane receptor protein